MVDEKLQSAEKANEEKKVEKKTEASAPKTVPKSMVSEEKILTINLRKNLVKMPYWKRTKDAVSILRASLKKKTSTDNIVIGKKLNEKLWARGIQKPSMKLRVKIIKDGDITRAELME